MITNDNPEPKPSASALPIPASAVAIDGANPAVGDEVEFTVKAKVVRVAGGQLFVEPSSINGEPIGVPEETPEDMSDDDMMNAAKSADEEDQASVTA